MGEVAHAAGAWLRFRPADAEETEGATHPAGPCRAGYAAGILAERTVAQLPRSNDGRSGLAAMVE
ncbi:hypothetical protein AV654_28615 [Paenibacillus elgii]|uniref:Uncharacterized protein n=1 Tax=Paenibacillus elgii TaxID=189691 RepID=A0A165QGM2_9BACL|nr:hypothetical protein AV654_28615 [Paenibacillus elgii]PUA37342.1 hypothetical protein C8Z91_20775 [Paenibacillus elgii]